MGIIRRHPVLFAVLGFLIITLPDAINNWFSLAERFNGAEGIRWLPILTDWVFPMLGLVLLIVIIRQVGKVKPTITFENETPPWLKQVLEDDKSNIGSRIYSRDYMWDFKKLSEPDPYIDLTFTLINASIFAINIQGLTGRLLVEKHECAQPAELISIKCLSHGEHRGIRIRQRLTNDMAALIINRRDLIPQSKMDLAKKGRIEISLRDCHLSISPEIDNELPKTIPLTIGGDYEVEIS